jgi:glycosyltransferase involved in cell wall biosynthesis
MSVPELSVVIIARNEEGAIGPCLESVMRATSAFRREVLFVDSASTDRTVDVALRHHVNVVRFSDNGLLSPAAGRWLGTSLTAGEYLLFVDGDMILVEGWIQEGMHILSDRQVGGVGGRLFWVAPGENHSSAKKDDLPLGVVPGLGGMGLYRRRALDECGSFNPFLRGEEERELAYRLARGGYSVVRMDSPMAYHLDKAKSMEENAGRSVYFAGVGQIMRRYAFQRIFWDLFREHIEVFVAWSLGFLLLAAGTVLLLTGEYRLLLWLAVTLLTLVAVRCVWKGPRRVWLYVHSRSLLAMRFTRGIFFGLPSPGRYPHVFAWIKRESLEPSNDASVTL